MPAYLYLVPKFVLSSCLPWKMCFVPHVPLYTYILYILQTHQMKLMQWILTFRDAHSACSRSPIKTDSAKHKRQTVSKKGKEWLRHQIWRLSSPTQIVFQLAKCLIFTMWTNTPPITRSCNSTQCGPGWKHGPDDVNGHVSSQKSNVSCSVGKQWYFSGGCNPQMCQKKNLYGHFKMNKFLEVKENQIK